MARLRGRARSPWPMSAVSLIVEARSLPLASVAARLDALQLARPAMTRFWRAVALGLTSSFAIFMLGVTMFGSALLNARFAKVTPDEQVILAALRVLRRDMVAERWGFGPGDRRRLTDGNRHAIELFLAYRHRPLLADGRLLKPAENIFASDDDRVIVARVLRRAPIDASEGDAASAHPRVREIVRRALTQRTPTLALQFMFALLIFFSGNGIASVLLAVLCRGVCLRLLGFDLVAADGTRASRLRVTARAAIAWSPVFVAR